MSREGERDRVRHHETDARDQHKQGRQQRRETQPATEDHRQQRQSCARRDRDAGREESGWRNSTHQAAVDLAGYHEAEGVDAEDQAECLG